MNAALKVSRGHFIRGSLDCPQHGQSIDFISIRDEIDGAVVRERYFCSRCLADAAGNKPWFYTNSPHGEDMLGLGVAPLDPVYSSNL